MSDLTAVQSVVTQAMSRAQPATSAKISSATVSDIGDRFSALLLPTKSKKITDDSAVKADNGVASRKDATAEVMQKFEAMVVTQLFGTMLKSMPGDSFGSGMSGDIYKSMFAEALGEQIAKNGGLGIAGLVRHTDANRLAENNGPVK